MAAASAGLPSKRRRAARRQRRQQRPHGVGERQQRRLPGDAEGDGRPSATASDATSRVMSGQTGKPAGPDHLAESVHREDQEAVERERLRQLAPAQAREERGGRDAEAEEERVRRLQPARRPRGRAAATSATSVSTPARPRSTFPARQRTRMSRTGSAGGRGSTMRAGGVRRDDSSRSSPRGAGEPTGGAGPG